MISLSNPVKCHLLISSNNNMNVKVGEFDIRMNVRICFGLN